MSLVLGWIVMVNLSQWAWGQNSSLYWQDLPLGNRQPATLENGSWTFIPTPPPKEIRVQDIVTIRVDHMSRMEARGDVQRRKNGLYDAALKDWVQLKGLTSLKPAQQDDGEPRAQGQINQLHRVQGDLQTRESLTFNIAARVTDIRPNGNLVLEAHQRIRNNDEVWEHSLSGICRAADIGPDNVLLSRDIVDLRLDKRELGQVRDGYKRGWFARLLDRLQPF